MPCWKKESVKRRVVSKLYDKKEHLQCKIITKDLHILLERENKSKCQKIKSTIVKGLQRRMVKTLINLNWTLVASADNSRICCTAHQPLRTGSPGAARVCQVEAAVCRPLVHLHPFCTAGFPVEYPRKCAAGVDVQSMPVAYPVG